MTTVAYVRVSTGGQDVQSQKDKLATYAKERDIKIGEWFVDEAVSGTLDERPQLQRLKDWCVDNHGSRVLCLGLDRTARDMYVYVSLERHFQEHEISVEYLGFSSTGNLATDQLMKNILASFAQYELDVIKERMNRGKRYLLKQGKFVMGGQPSYGYRYEGQGRDKSIKINQEEAEVVKKIFTLYGEKDWSVRRIRRYLNKRGIVPGRRGRSRTAQTWAISSINHMLKNTSYIGKFVYGKTKTVGFGKTKKEVNRLPGEEGFIELKVPSIIAEPLFKKAQAKKKSKTRTWNKKQKTKHFYILKGLLHCGVCNRFMFSGSGASGNHYYYRCNSATHRKDTGKEPCGNPTLKGGYVEAIVLNELYKLLDGGNKSKLEEMVNKFKTSIKDKTAKYQQTLKEFGKLKEAKERLLDMLGRGTINEDDYKVQAQKYQNKMVNCAVLIREHDEFIEHLAKLDISYIRKGLIKIGGKEKLMMDEALKKRDKQTLRDLIFKYITKITVYPNKLDIVFTLPNMEDKVVAMSKDCQSVGNSNKLSFLLTVPLNKTYKLASLYTYAQPHILTA